MEAWIRCPCMDTRTRHCKFAPHHHADQFLLRRLCHKPGSDQSAVAQYTDAAANGKDLLQAMRDEHDDFVKRPEGTNNTRELGNFGARERRGRFVKQKYFAA